MMAGYQGSRVFPPTSRLNDTDPDGIPSPSPTRLTAPTERSPVRRTATAPTRPIRASPGRTASPTPSPTGGRDRHRDGERHREPSGGGGDDHPPVALDDVLTTNANTPGSVYVLGNDSDPDGDPLTVSSFTQRAHGVAHCGISGFCSYTADVGFSGTDIFTYTVSDGRGGTGTGRVDVTVNEPPPGTLTIDKRGSGGGTVSSTPAGSIARSRAQLPSQPGKRSSFPQIPMRCPRLRAGAVGDAPAPEAAR